MGRKRGEGKGCIEGEGRGKEGEERKRNRRRLDREKGGREWAIGIGVRKLSPVYSNYI